MTGIEAMVKQMQSIVVRPTVLRDKILQLQAEGRSQRLIAFDCGVSRTTVFNILRAERERIGEQS